MPAKPTPTTPEPDEHGRLRVLDEDTGHRYSIPASRLHLGRYSVLDEPASTAAGDPMPPVHAAGGPGPVEPTTDTGQQAGTPKE